MSEKMSSWKQPVTMAYLGALKLKAKLTVAREEYRFQWYNMHETFANRSMDAMFPAAGPQKVAMTVFPGLCVAKEGRRSEVLFKAKVVLRPDGEGPV